jgi:threonine dehydrogenase-like Zn-dependent dehydrogenase
MKGPYETYREGRPPGKKMNRLWPLYGAGMENLGVANRPIEAPLPEFGPDELLIRHDACGLCFSDVKVIKLGEEHPRIYRDMKKDPVVLGHEVALTVVGVGENLKDRYRPGDRFTLQADIWVDGVGYAYGYEIQGGLSEYAVLDRRVLDGDRGNALISIRPETGYAEAALVEPWACVIAAYHLEYRTAIKDGGAAWFIGPEKRDFRLSRGIDAAAHPKTIKLTDVGGPFGRWLRARAAELGIPVVEVAAARPADEAPPAEDLADDIILLAPTPELIETAGPYLAGQGVMALASEEKLGRDVQVDIGRIHYNRWVHVGGTSADIADLYGRVPVRSALKKGGRALFVGAGGPMGRMHVQHAVEASAPPSLIVCSDVSDERLEDLRSSFADEAREKGLEWVDVNPARSEAYRRAMARFEKDGFDDIIVLTPVPAAISEAARRLAERGVMNIFAGVARGTKTGLDLDDAIFRGTRIIGHSASSMEDMFTMLNEVESRRLSTNRSVAAIGSLEAAKDGLRALQEAVYPGKVVIFPNIKPLPLTGLPDLKKILPGVAAKLRNGREWTTECERALLDALLD